MNATRQDAWSKDEDIILAETVLRYIREGRTQLEAFKEVAKKLSRTSAACGFRWNATIRKQYQEAILAAKEDRKKGNRKDVWQWNEPVTAEKDSIEAAITLLEKMRKDFFNEKSDQQKQQENMVVYLKNENERLKKELGRYESTWKEMGELFERAKVGERE
ncbi:RsfA family transcriptional regulator [Virgibacillus sp. YIM 98842]|jgi:RsfA family transcription factor|uniref:RsfA family transcriptional regulator n=1 Tax=Virgibacillus sp. YIM 98842 TaxID=2663533 RepID=UPI0013DC7125|nr:RsfA family transcriptional regulator [Virgibacillus sp. YIM 98842]